MEEFSAITSKRSKEYLNKLPYVHVWDDTDTAGSTNVATSDHSIPTLLPSPSTFWREPSLVCGQTTNWVRADNAVDPRKRFTVEQCLTHPYLDAYHDPEDEPSAKPLDPSFFDFDDRKDNLEREELKGLL